MSCVKQDRGRNVLRMPRPNRDRRSVTLYIARSGIEAVDRMAAKYGVTRSEVIRAALKAGLPLVGRELGKNAAH